MSKSSGDSDGCLLFMVIIIFALVWGIDTAINSIIERLDRIEHKIENTR